MRTLKNVGSRGRNLARRVLRASEGASMVVHARSTAVYAEHGRKSLPRMMLENVTWALRHAEVNTNYFLYGLHLRRAPHSDNYLGHRQCMNMINRQIAAAGARDVARLLKDKLAFGEFTGKRGYSTPENVAVLRDDRVQWCSTGEAIGYDELIARADGLVGFCKPVGGQHAQGVFPLCIRDGCISIAGSEVGPDSLRKRVTEPYLLQRRIRQHEAMACFHPASVNTIRLVTALEEARGIAYALGAVVRMGINGNAVDSFSVGGVVVPVDLDHGTLRESGCLSGGGGRVLRHPDSHVSFPGYKVPMFAEAVDVACRLHRDLGRLRTVGWDIAIRDEGPCIVEGNSHWNQRLLFFAEPQIKPRLTRLYQDCL